MYIIEIDYATGNSFGSERLCEEIDIQWKNIDMAKESLKRIANHYEFYEENNGIYSDPDMELPVGAVWDKKYRMIMLELVDDDGKPYLYSSFWTGYFETLYSAKIIADNKDLVYEP